MRKILLRTPDTNRMLFYSVLLVFFATAVALILLPDYIGLFKAINSPDVLGGRRLWSILTVLGDGLLVPVVAAALFGKHPKLFWHLLLAALIATAITRTGKQTLQMQRPAAVLPQQSIEITGHTLKHRSFPSGHTATVATVVSVAIWYVTSTGLRATLLVLLVLGGVSRIVVGAHWPLDVAFGWMIGWWSAAFAAVLLPQKKRETKPVLRGILLTILAFCGIFGTIAYDSGYLLARPFFRLLLFLSAIMAAMHAAGFLLQFRVGKKSTDIR